MFVNSTLRDILAIYCLRRMPDGSILPLNSLYEPIGYSGRDDVQLQDYLLHCVRIQASTKFLESLRCDCHSNRSYRETDELYYLYCRDCDPYFVPQIEHTKAYEGRIYRLMKKAIQVLPLHDRHRAPKLCKQGPSIEEIHAATGHDIGLYVSAMLVLDVSQGNPPPWVGPWSELAHAVMAKADALWPEPFNKLQGRDEFGMVGAAFMTAKSSWTRHDSLAEIGVTVECCDLDRQVIKYVRISASHLHHDLPPLEEVVREIIESELTA